MTIRFSTLTLDQLNELLYKICQEKKVQVLDILGLKISDKDLCPKVDGKLVSLRECSAIHFSHVGREQAAALSRDTFHFLRLPAEV